MADSTFRLTAGTLLALISLIAAASIFAAEAHQARQEYGQVLQELRSFRREFDEFRIDQARLHAAAEKEQR
jgi:hypothetical protein